MVRTEFTGHLIASLLSSLALSFLLSDFPHNFNNFSSEKDMKNKS